MAEEAMVSCQIPPDWKEKIERLAALRKKQPSQIMYEALAQYLGEDAEKIDTRLSLAETELLTLKKEVSQLNKTVQNLQQRLQTAANIISIAGDGLVSSSPKVQSMPPAVEEDFDDFEDEPDEILYDFLPPEERY